MTQIPVIQHPEMVNPQDLTAKTNLLGMSKAELSQFFADLGEKPFRATQVMKWIYQFGVTDFYQMTNLSKKLQQTLVEVATVSPPTVKFKQFSEDGTMIGRAGQGQPWIFRDIAHYLETGEILPSPTMDELKEIVLSHLQEIYAFYGEYSGCRIARKHIAWYTSGIANSNAFRQAMYEEDTTAGQFNVVAQFLKTAEFD